VNIVGGGGVGGGGGNDDDDDVDSGGSAGIYGLQTMVFRERGLNRKKNETKL